jgi:hypothetical protein
MPLKRCQDEDKPGWKWGDAPSAKCYVYTPGDEESEKAARKKAMAQAAAMGEFPGTGGETRSAGDASPASEEAPAEPILYRSASVVGVNFAQRVIEFVAAPYDEEAVVMWRGEPWRELFVRGAWDGIEKRPNRVKVNREHDKTRTVGKITNFWPSRQEGLVGAARISQTPLGDETLALADDQVLGPSVGYVAPPKFVDLDKRSRSVKRAIMDHLAFVSDPTWEAAAVLAVRNANQPQSAADLPRLETPALDELREWFNSRNSKS